MFLSKSFKNNQALNEQFEIFGIVSTNKECVQYLSIYKNLEYFS